MSGPCQTQVRPGIASALESHPEERGRVSGYFWPQDPTGAYPSSSSQSDTKGDHSSPGPCPARPHPWQRSGDSPALCKAGGPREWRWIPCPLRLPGVSVRLSGPEMRSVEGVECGDSCGFPLCSLSFSTILWIFHLNLSKTASVLLKLEGATGQAQASLPVISHREPRAPPSQRLLSQLPPVSSHLLILIICGVLLTKRRHAVVGGTGHQGPICKPRFRQQVQQVCQVLYCVQGGGGRVSGRAWH